MVLGRVFISAADEQNTINVFVVLLADLIETISWKNGQLRVVFLI